MVGSTARTCARAESRALVVRSSRTNGPTVVTTPWIGCGWSPVAFHESFIILCSRAVHAMKTTALASSDPVKTASLCRATCRASLRRSLTRPHCSSSRHCTDALSGATWDTLRYHLARIRRIRLVTARGPACTHLRVRSRSASLLSPISQPSHLASHE